MSKLLNIAIIGNTDDGKSTLIGRFLFDSDALYKDHLAQIKLQDSERQQKHIKFSHVTDGLQFERAENITIDVAHISFSTENYKYVFADTPGHIKYLHNMISGISNADVAIVMIDVEKGLLEQSKRHILIASLFQVPYLIILINKIDLINYDQDIYKQLVSQCKTYISQLSIINKIFIPVSAEYGDNIVNNSIRTPWYQGPTLFDYLESTFPERYANHQDFRLFIQNTLATTSGTAYFGQIASGSVKVEDLLFILPSKTHSRVKKLFYGEDEVGSASVGDSIAIYLEDDLSAIRGNLFAGNGKLPVIDNKCNAIVVWLSRNKLNHQKQYILQQNTRRTEIKSINTVQLLDFERLNYSNVNTLNFSEIGKLQIKSISEVIYDCYKSNKNTGYFILIDPVTNETSAVGFFHERD